MSLIKIKISLTLFLLYIIVKSFGKPQRTLPFPHLTDFKISDIGKPLRIFEGIDYDQLPSNIRDEYNNCYSEQYKCIRSRTQHSPVCGYDLRNKTFKRYFSQCLLNFHNCKLMVAAGRGMHGRDFKDRIIFFMGEGYTCQIYFRSNHATTEISTKQ